MPDFMNLVMDWAAAHRAPLAAALIAVIAAVPFVALKLAVTAKRRRQIRQLADSGRNPTVWALRQGHSSANNTDLRKALYAPTEAATLAVLPLDDRTGGIGGPDLCQQFTDDLVTLLARSADLDVSAPSYSRSADATAGTIIPVPADYVLEASMILVRGGDRPAVEIRMQIIETATGDSVFGDAYTSEIARLGSVHDEIAETVSSTLGSTMRVTPHPDASRAPTASLAAWALHQRAEESLRTGLSRQRLDDAGRLLDHAARIDPGFGDAKAALASTIALRALFLTSADPQTDLVRASTILDAAQAVGPDTHSIAIAEGLIALSSGAYGPAQTAFVRADRLMPGSPVAAIYKGLASLYANEAPDLGAVRTTLDTTDEAAQRTLARYVIGLDLVQRGAYLEAAELMEQSVTGVRAFHMAWFLGALAQALDGRIDQAKDVFFRGRRVMGPAEDTRIRDWVARAAANPERARLWLTAFDASWR